MAKRDNGGHARSIRTERPSSTTWDTFDALPREVRYALWAAPVAISPASAAGLIEYGGSRYAVREIASACAGELEAFAREHRTRHGYELPHVAAEAEVMGY